VETDGWVLPVSTCERRLAETPTAEATFLKLNLRERRTLRSFFTDSEMHRVPSCALAPEYQVVYHHLTELISNIHYLFMKWAKSGQTRATCLVKLHINLA